jgi:hypothetical protein
MFAETHLSSLRTRFISGLIAATLLTAAAAQAVSQSTNLQAHRAQIAESYGSLRLSFEANRGQTDPSARFLSRGSGYGLYLTGDEAVLALCRPLAGAARPASGGSKNAAAPRSAACAKVEMQLAGAGGTEPLGEERLPGTANYFIGSDPAKWHTNIPTYAKVRYRDIYPGIDLVYYGNHRELEYDFVVAPGADARAIALRFEGAAEVRRAANGDLVVRAADGTLIFRKPVIYQTVNRQRVQVAGEFAVTGKQTVGFRLGSYDRGKPLVIDPVLVYATFLGGSGDANSALLGGASNAIAVDAAGNAYVTGQTLSTNFPVTAGVLQGTDPGAADQAFPAFVTKLNASGTALVYSTYMGGNGGDQASAIAVDAAGDAYVAGQTASHNFPVTADALQTANKATMGGEITAFISELNPTGTALVYSTYLGGSIIDGAAAIAVDTAGNAYVAGQTSSTDFPVTQGAYQTTNKSGSSLASNAFVSKLNPGGTALIYSTFLGGSGGTRMGEGGCITSAAASNDLLGWAVGNNEDGAFAIAVDGAGDAYVAGQALSTDFPVTQGAYQAQNNGASTAATNAFVAKLNPAGSSLLYSTYLGGSGTPCPSNLAVGYDGDTGLALAVDSSGDAYVAGVTFSMDFPVTQSAFQTTNQFSFKGIAGPTAFVAKLNPSGSGLVYSTYLGGSGGFINFTPFFAQYGGDQVTGLAVDSSDDAYVTGGTASLNFPVTAGAFQTANASATGSGGALYNAFVAKLNPAGSALLYSTYLGGNGSNPNVESNEHAVSVGDQANALALDSSGNVYIAGQVESADFPVTNGAFQTTIPAYTSAFIAKLDLPSSSGLATPTVTVTPATAQLTNAEPLVVTIAVTGGSGSATPTGSVTLSSGSYSSAATSLNGGSAVIEIPAGALAVGSDKLTANYPGDSNYAATMGTATVSVAAAPASGYAITGSAVTVAAGATTGNTSTITVTPDGGFTGSVTLTAALTSSPSGAVNLPTMSFGSTGSVNITGTGSGTATLTISTTAEGGCAPFGVEMKTAWYMPGGATLALLVLFGVPRGWRRRTWLGLLLLVCLCGVSACGSSGPKGGCNAITAPTTPGTYYITVTGTSGTTTGTGIVTLTVQ